MSKRDEFIGLGQSQVGYAESGKNITKYSSYFDKEAWQWFNTKKQGAEWCAIFICWLFCMLLGPDKARTFLGCPAPKNNCAAGVKYLWKYLVARGWKVDKTQGQPGDIIFLGSGNSHVGFIEAIANGRYQTIEGNKSDKVARGSYAMTSSTVYGICRPNWAEIDGAPTPEPAPEPTPAPTPAPEPEYNYKVKTNGSSLALRSAPNAKSTCLAWMPNGTKLKITTQQNGWGRTSYNGHTGWCYMKWTKEI